MRQLHTLWIALATSALMVLSGQAYAVDSEALGDELTKIGETLKTSKIKDNETDADNEKLKELEELKKKTPPLPVAPTA